jgi:two-component system OmpR family sensor kinase/two-component system sensor histidine kinase BaeS
VVDAAILEKGAPVVVDGATVARLVSLRTPGQMGYAEEALMAQVQTAIMLSALIAGVLALAIGALLVASVLQPLRAVERTVTAVANGNLTARVAVRGQDEIANLGSAVNNMAETLQAQEALRQRLVSDVAHELRTPLSVIQGNLQAILDGIYPLYAEEIRTVLDETQLLSRLVTDLHELAQAEAGRLPLQRQQLPVASILSHLSDLYAPIAAQKGIALHVAPPPAQLEVNADPDRLQQILHNLVGNALRHTPNGETIHIRSEVENGRENTSHASGAVRFTIQDTGSGINAGDLPFVFERFYRGEAGRPRPTEPVAGAGLGLAIAKALVQAHGGQIGVYATTPHGATFWFTLPAGAPTSSPPATV